MNEVLKELVREHNAYIVTQRKNIDQLTTDDIPFKIEFFEAMSPKTAKWYEKEISELNFRVFGPMGLNSKAWVDIHFGGMAGATVGLKEKNGSVISMTRFVGHISSNKFQLWSQLWTFMVDPVYQRKGVGKATLALTCSLNRNKEWMSYITQIEDEALKLYLKLRSEKSPLYLVGIGFYHSRMPSSIGIEMKVPKKPWEVLFGERAKVKIDNPLFLDEINDLKKVRDQPILVSTRSKRINDLGENIVNGTKYEIIEWFSQTQARERFDFEEPLLVIRKIM